MKKTMPSICFIVKLNIVQKVKNSFFNTDDKIIFL